MVVGDVLPYYVKTLLVKSGQGPRAKAQRGKGAGRGWYLSTESVRMQGVSSSLPLCTRKQTVTCKHANSVLTQVRVYATIKIVNSEAGFIHHNVDRPEN